jgi:hypothetical protein
MYSYILVLCQWSRFQESRVSQEICPAPAMEDSDADSDIYIVSEKISLQQGFDENESEEIIYSNPSSKDEVCLIKL